MAFSRTHARASLLPALVVFTMAAALSACSGSSDDPVAAPDPVVVQPPPPPPAAVAPQLTLVAGNNGGPGVVDGAASSARFSLLSGIAVGRDNTVYIADTDNNIVRKLAGGVVTTIAGVAGYGGYADGNVGTARFFAPSAISVDRSNNLYVVDRDNLLIRKIDTSGNVSTFAGALKTYGNEDGQGAAARFTSPAGIVNDAAGNVYVVDRRSDSTVQRLGVLRKITPAGNVTTLATNDSSFTVLGDGIAADPAGNLYVVGAVGNDTIVIRIETLPGGPPSYDITLRTPKLLRISAAGDVTTLGTVEPDGRYTGVTVDASGNLYFVNSSYHTVYRYAAATQTIGVFAGSYGGVSYDHHGLPSYPYSLGSADGVGTAAQFGGPEGIATDSEGNLYIADKFNFAIRKVSPAAVVTTVAGAARRLGSANGAALQATFGRYLTGSTVDGAGNIYVTDQYAYAVRKIGADGQVVTLAGKQGISGSVDGNGDAARFDTPRGVASDSSGNLYIADSFNGTIRKVGPTGQVTTIAGNPANRGQVDGTGTDAQFQLPGAIARDSAGNLFVTDFGLIRKITPAGVVTTIAGTPNRDGIDRDGTGAAATFNMPYAITVDGNGNAYIADIYSHTIRRISAAGEVVTIAGKQSDSGAADGPGATARFAVPTGIVIDSSGNLYVSDSGNNAVRKITPDGTVSTVIKSPASTGSAPEENLQSISYKDDKTLFLTVPGGILRLDLGTR